MLNCKVIDFKAPKTGYIVEVAWDRVLIERNNKKRTVVKVSELRKVYGKDVYHWRKE